MMTNDNILRLMIEKDMLSRKVTDYQIQDEVISNPKLIKVGANQVVYVCYCQIKSSGDFVLKLASGTGVISYHPKNMISNVTTFHSSQLTSHWSNIKIIPKLTDNYFVRFIRISITATILLPDLNTPKNEKS